MTRRQNPCQNCTKFKPFWKTSWCRLEFALTGIFCRIAQQKVKTRKDSQSRLSVQVFHGLGLSSVLNERAFARLVYHTYNELLLSSRIVSPSEC